MKKIVLSTVLACLMISAHAQTLRYVNQAATGLNDGTSWENAYTSLHAAIDSCEAGDTLWVAEGVYTPDESNRYVSFTPDGIVMLGGFAGNETSAGERDPIENPTVISGDLDGDDVGRTNNSENSLHVIVVTASGNACVIDGFHIAGANANGSAGDPRLGGGLRLNSGSATPLEIRNCIIRDNFAYNGAGIYIYRDASGYHTVHIENCVFDNNSCGIYGSAVYSFWRVNTTVTNCTFVSNLSKTIYKTRLEGTFEIYNSIFADTGDTYLYADNSAEFTVDHCLFDVDSSTFNGSTVFTDNLINTDPVLNSEYHLLPASPARDAGRNDVVTMTKDLAGIDRIMNDTVDMGAYEFNTTPPVATITTGITHTYDTLIQAAVEFSESVSGLELNDFSITNGTVSGLETVSAGREYTFNITNRLSGPVTIVLLPESVQNNNEIYNDSASASYTYTDTLRPTVSLEVETGGDSQITRVISVTFNEEITGLETDDFVVTNSTASNLQETEAGMEYTVDVTAAGDGEVTVTLPDSVVTDINGNYNTAAVLVSFTYTHVSGLPDYGTDKITIYPNPAQNYLVIDCPDFTRYELYTGNGVLVNQGTEKELIVRNLEAGMYYLKIYTSGNTPYNKKLMLIK